MVLIFSSVHVGFGCCYILSFFVLVGMYVHRCDCRNPHTTAAQTHTQTQTQTHTQAQAQT